MIYELAQRETITATVLTADLRFDPGSLSRILKEFVERGLIARRTRTRT
jgi:DNA-binding MarR family transcriptional regulator